MNLDTTKTKKFKKIFEEILSITTEKWNKNSLNKLLRKHKSSKQRIYRNDELVEAYNALVSKKIIEKNKVLENRIRLKPTRSNSGVAVVTVLTKPFPCIGKCIFCPNDPNMPKSYIASEPGAQRALLSKFDPYAQVFNRIVALKKTGHNVEKIELIVLGGSWSVYPLDYRIWFVNECFKAINDITAKSNEYVIPQEDSFKETTWSELEKNQIKNEEAFCRNVGLVFETRPDCITEEEVISMRRLGATKVQIGIQTLSDEIAKQNNLGRGIKEVKNAFSLLRRAGFKIHGHWMVALYKSTPEIDKEEFKKLWKENFCPDELKIYPTSVIPNTPLSKLYNEGKYIPYSTGKLIDVLESNIASTPRYCRLSRIIRDIPSDEIEAGSKVTNLRQIVERNLKEKNVKINEIRSREIKGREINRDDLQLESIIYNTTVSTEYFISYKTKKDDLLCAFLRLSVPKTEYLRNNFIEELNGSSIVREIHVYGTIVGLKQKGHGESQHLGLGRMLIKEAEKVTKANNISKISVISAIGTRKYYKSNAFAKGELYMYKDLS